MGLGKTYSADYLIDSNGNTGVSGQVLISTATGIDWADGSAITGGPFLPLAGGTLTGNLTISNASPALNLTDTDNASNISFSSVGGALIVNSSSDQVYQIAGAEKMRINSSGNVGIGTSNINFSNGGGLVVGSGGASRLKIANATTGYGATDGLELIQSGVDSYIYNYEAGPMYFGTSSSTRITILSAGNVGIGTTDPGAKLEVNVTDDTFNDINVLKLKRTWATASGSDRAHGISFNDANSNNATIYVDRTNSGANYNSDLLFATNTGTSGTSVSTKMVIKADGNVGIGTDTPIDELHVEGVIQSKKHLLPSTSGTAGWYKIGTMSGFVQGGATAVLEIAGHQGYNATNNQDYLIKLFIKTSNASSTGPDGQGFNSWYERTGGNNATIEFKWNNSATNDYDLYMFIPTHSLRSWYSVKKGTGTWEHAGTSATDPGANSSAVLKATGLFNILDANVGIGTTAPSQKLTVVGNTYVSSGLLLLDNNQDIRWGDAGERITGHNTNGLVFTTNNFETMRINSQGKVGIGTTDPGSLLQVGGLDDGSNYDITLGWNAVDSEAVGTKRSAITFKTAQTSVNTEDIYKWDIAMLAAPATVTGEEFGSDLAFLRSTRGSTATDATTMILTRTGNVGIGCTPDQKLHVKGTIETQATNSTNGWQLYTYTDNTFRINYNGAGSDELIIDSSGNVGIGTTSPNQKLQVGGNLHVYDEEGNTDSSIFLSTGTSDVTTVKIASNGDSFFNAGNVGIGTTAPDAPLHILKAAGGANIVAGLKLDPDDATANSGISIDFNASTTNTGASLVGSRIVGAREGGNASGFLALYTSPDASGSVPLERMRITSGGNVGIGTTDPTSALTIKGTSPYIRLERAGVTTWEIRQNYPATEYGFQIVNVTAGTIPFFVGASNNVGIGTTSPAAKLDVVVSNVSVTPNADSSAVFRKNGHNYISILSGGTNEGGVIFGNSADAADGWIAYKHGTGAADQAFSFGTANGERMRITKGGDVGIGTTSPINFGTGSHLITVQAASGGGYGGLLAKTDNVTGQIWANEGGDNVYIGTRTNHPLILTTHNVEKARIATSGNVGIGTTSTSYRLTVDNDAANTNNPALYVKNPNSNTAAVIAEFVGDSDSIQIKNIGTGDYAIYNSQQSNGIALFDGAGGVEIKYAGTTTLESDSTGGIKVTGQLSATGDVVAYSSDERLKENIKPIESAVDKIKQLKGVTFDWNEKSEELGFEPSTKTNDVGVIAQDVEAVFPQLVQLAPFDIARGEDGNATSKSGEDYKTVNYARLTAVLIEAVKEQQQQIDELKKQIK